MPTNHDPQSAPGVDPNGGSAPGTDPAPTTAPGRPGVAAPLSDSADVPSDAPVSKTGTTTVAIATDDAVVLAADRRASLGGRFVSNKNVVKVEQVHPSAAITLSGSVGGVQAFARSLRAEASLYETRRGEPPSMEALSTLAGNLIRGVPAQVQLGGVDEGGPALFELDAGGSVLETEYAAGGSGMQLAYGHLEDAHGSVEGIEEARAVATRAVESASERDTASGNGITVATVTADGVETDTVEEVGGVN